MRRQVLMSYCRFDRAELIIVSVFIVLGFAFITQNPLFATTAIMAQGEEPNINALTVFEEHTMILGSNIKDLVMLIPNEGHESTNQQKSQFPLANQPYFPQNAVINVGTTVTWFNGDVDHDHTITLSGKSTNSEFESGEFVYNTASKPITFNDTGTYNYFETDVNNDDPSFVMNGTINAIDQVNPLINANATAVNPDTVGTYMVPAKDLDQYISTLTSKGLTIDSTYTFEDLRGGQKGTGPEQTLIVWTTSGMNLDQVISILEEITPSLPYS